MAVLVTGGIGFIGSHTVVELLADGQEVIIVDDLSNSRIEVLDAIKEITTIRPKFYEINYLDKEKMRTVFKENKIDTVINLAGYKSVGESVSEPLMYYHNNVAGAINVLEVMKEFGVKNFIFSSTATVYGVPENLPLTEESQVGGTTNPYATSKLMIEQILQDLYKSDNSWNICILRYFNPIGAHESGLIGEEPKGIPNNLMPYITKVANGDLEILNVFGDDYNTKDGTGVRDYIHVVDLAKGHIKAMKKLKKESSGIYIYNLGRGVGYSVLDVIQNFEKANNLKINYRIIERRPGDIDAYYASPEKAVKELEWKVERNLEEMCRDSWNYIKTQNGNKK